MKWYQQLLMVMKWYQQLLMVMFPPHLPEPPLGALVVVVVHGYHAEVEVDALVAGVPLHQPQQPRHRHRPQHRVIRLLRENQRDGIVLNATFGLTLTIAFDLTLIIAFDLTLIIAFDLTLNITFGLTLLSI